MTEHRAPYQVSAVKEPNPTGIPVRWLRFLYRLASLHGGQTYMIAVTIPDKADGEPTWTVLGNGPIENKG